MGGVIIEGGQVLVHINKGVVKTINGIVLEDSTKQSPTKNKIIHKVKDNQSVDDKIVIISLDNEREFRYAYKIISEELGSYIYIDTENNDTLKIVPFINDVQTTITTNTLYYGRQILNVDAIGQWRYFSVQNPRIESIDLSDQSLVGEDSSTYSALIQLCNTFREREVDSLDSYVSNN